MNTKKPREDAKLKSLPPEQRELLCRWLTVDNISYKEARLRVKAQFGLHVGSDSTFTDFYHSVALPWSYAQSAGVADAFSQAAEGNLEPAAIKRIRQLLFDAAASRKTDFRALKTLAQIVGNAQKHTLAAERLELDKRKVKLLEAKAAQADQVAGLAGDKNLSPQEKERRIKAVFGIT